eukprot:gnl/TRDRNA2_/TRDRNA2_192946_c0_seq1.p1 gnl/TRDRNA2_/TRDRNA2_192946_c0~~gnl/TRDRNA2_/TRDRNA2_192946_c0_seq1.p1  ORF type:complete len:223 (+),score=66.07 gnl/TRDRNA2_/TRDRNA2_192946_c0_seq1:50-718(+)
MGKSQKAWTGIDPAILAKQAPKAPICEAIVIRGTTGASGSADKVAIDQKDSRGDQNPADTQWVPEKITNYYSSVAGASSDFFPMYRKFRNAELERLREMDQYHDEKEKAEAFQAIRERQAENDDAVTKAKADKRKRKKENAEKNKKLRQEATGINKFESNGNFLEMMKSMSPEELEKAAKAQVEAAVPAAGAGPSAARPMPVVSAKQMNSASNITFRDVDDD